MKKFCWLICLVYMVGAPTAVLAWGIEFSVGAWYQRPRGVISYDKTTNVDDLDLEDDLNYDDKWKPAGRLKVDMPFLFPNLYLMYTPMKWDEKGRKNVDFSFGGVNFRGDVDFDSELKMNHLDAALYYGIPGCAPPQRIFSTSTWDSILDCWTLKLKSSRMISGRRNPKATSCRSR